MIVDIKWDSKYKCGIIESDYLNNIRGHFSVINKNAFLRGMHNRWTPTRKSIITKNGRFEIGLFAEIYKFAQKQPIPIQFNLDKEFCARFKPSYNLLNLRINALKLDLRDYQLESVQKCLKQGNGTLVLATAAGKTLIIATLVNILQDNIAGHRTVIIVPTLQLVEQTYKDFIDYGINKNLIAKLSGDNKFTAKPIIIANSQYLLVSKNIPNILFDADLLIIDEIHGARYQNQLNKLIKRFDTPHRYGLTGTLPEDPLDIWNIIGKTGPLIYEKSSKALRDQGFLANVAAQILRLRYKKEPKYTIPSMADPLGAYNIEREFIYTSSFRNNLLTKLATKTPHNTLIIVSRIAHGKTLYELIKKSTTKTKKVYFIQGEVEIGTREKIRELMEKSDNIIVIAIAKIFSTGINIRNLHYVVLAAAGKAKVQMVQSIGRGMRLNANKEKLQIFDISDQLKYSKKHEKKRIAIYKTEEIKYKITEITEK